LGACLSTTVTATRLRLLDQIVEVLRTLALISGPTQPMRYEYTTCSAVGISCSPNTHLTGVFLPVDFTDKNSCKHVTVKRSDALAPHIDSGLPIVGTVRGSGAAGGAHSRQEAMSKTCVSASPLPCRASSSSLRRLFGHRPRTPEAAQRLCAHLSACAATCVAGCTLGTCLGRSPTAICTTCALATTARARPHPPSLAPHWR